MENVEQEIINAALGMFNKYGIRSVSMDDVARELGISKKTIYKYFENKAELVHKSLMVIHTGIRDLLLEVHAQSENPIDELFEIDSVVCRVMENHNPSLQFQLQKYYPQTYSKMYEGRHELLHKMIAENIEKGKEGSWYRQEANTEIVTFLYCSKVETMPEDEQVLLTRYNMAYVTRQALEYHIRGLASEKGLNYLNEKLKPTE